MSNFEPNKRHLRKLLIYFFKLKKSAAEAHRLLVEAYGQAALSERSCREWYQKFKNGEFDIEDKVRSGRPKLYEDEKLEALLNQDSCQTQEELALTLGVTQQAISHRLKSQSLIKNGGNLFVSNMNQKPMKITKLTLSERRKSKRVLAKQAIAYEKTFLEQQSKEEEDVKVNPVVITECLGTNKVVDNDDAKDINYGRSWSSAVVSSVNTCDAMETVVNKMTYGNIHSLCETASLIKPPLDKHNVTKHTNIDSTTKVDSTSLYETVSPVQQSKKRCSISKSIYSERELWTAVSRLNKDEAISDGTFIYTYNGVFIINK